MRQKYKVALPTIMLGNVRSVNNKKDELSILAKYHPVYRDSCALVLTETWMKEGEDGIQLDHFTVERCDRTEESKKTKAGGVCICINSRWCTNYCVKASSCTPNLEVLCVQCRPFYLPREISCVALIAVYIPPDGDKKRAMKDLANIITDLEDSKPDAAIIAIGDFNRAPSLSKILPRYRQFITCATREQSTIDLCYCKIPKAYTSRKMSQLGRSDHHMIQLRPSYVRKLKAVKPTTRTVKEWTDENKEAVAGSLACTDWSVFFEAGLDLDTLTTTVTDYIQFCVDSLVPNRTIKVFGNNKPWMTKDIRDLILAKHSTRKSGDKQKPADKQRLKEAQKQLDRAIAAAKTNYKDKVEQQFARGSKACWDGLKAMSEYNKKKATSPNGKDQQWANELNNFYCRFEKPDPCPSIATSETDTVITIKEDEVCKCFKSTRANKAAGPDGFSPRLLKHYADYIALPYCRIFNLSLQQMKVPTPWKESTIVPVPKKPKPAVMNDYRPVALTSAIMKRMERLVVPHLVQLTAHAQDPLQFAYKKGRGVDDAVALLTHKVLEHLEKPNRYVRILFIDFSSAFNTMLPSVMIRKLSNLGVHPTLCKWILDYLRGRSQCVRIGDVMSEKVTTNIGAPQGTGLSPVAFTLYTNDHRGTPPSTYAPKYADDAALAGLIEKDDETEYRRDVANFVSRCDSDGLELNVGKTREMIIDFRMGERDHRPLNIKGTDVALVTEYDYLGTTLSSDTSWSANVKKLVSKASKRLHHLRKLREFGVDPEIMELFYNSVIGSVLLSGVAVWGGHVEKQDQKSIDKIRKKACRIVGRSLPTWKAGYDKRVHGLGAKMLRDSSHPLNPAFRVMPSGRRIEQLKLKNERFKMSCVPQAICSLNKCMPKMSD